MTSTCETWEKVEEKVQRFYDTPEKFTRFVDQTVCDYYRHAIDETTYEQMIFVLTTIASKYSNHDSWSLLHFVWKLEKEYETFYSDAKTVAALMMHD